MKHFIVFLITLISFPAFANDLEIENPFLKNNAPQDVEKIEASPKVSPEIKTEDKKPTEVKAAAKSEYYQQKLFNIKVEADYTNVAGSQALEGPVNFIAKKINPNSARLVIPAFSAKGDVPISVLTDEKGDLKAMVLGEDMKEVTFNINGKADRIIQSAVYVAPEAAARKRMKIDASSSMRDQQELFYLDASELKATTGGKIKIRYVSSLLTGGTNELEINLSRVGQMWVATTDDGLFSRFVRKEKIIKEAKISPSLIKMGLSSPDYTFAEINEFASVERAIPMLSAGEIKARLEASKENIRSLASSVNGATRFQNIDFNLRYSEPESDPALERKLAPVEDRSVSAAN